VRILGIDPGSRITGYGCIEGDPDRPLDRPRLREAGAIRLATRRPLHDRIVELHADLDALLERLRPRLVAVEELYAHYDHPATAIRMGHARGVILLAVRARDIDLVELRPTSVKKSTTGRGRADKGRIQRAVQAEFGLAEPPDPPDIADALALALTALRRADRLTALAEGGSA